MNGIWLSFGPCTKWGSSSAIINDIALLSIYPSFHLIPHHSETLHHLISPVLCRLTFIHSVCQCAIYVCAWVTNMLLSCKAAFFLGPHHMCYTKVCEHNSCFTYIFIYSFTVEQVLAQLPPKRRVLDSVSYLLKVGMFYFPACMSSLWVLWLLGY